MLTATSKLRDVDDSSFNWDCSFKTVDDHNSYQCRERDYCWDVLFDERSLERFVGFWDLFNRYENSSSSEIWKINEFFPWKIGAAVNSVLVPGECIETTQILSSKDPKEWSVQVNQAISQVLNLFWEFCWNYFFFW